MVQKAGTHEIGEIRTLSSLRGERFVIVNRKIPGVAERITSPADRVQQYQQIANYEEADSNQPCPVTGSLLLSNLNLYSINWLRSVTSLHPALFLVVAECIRPDVGGSPI